MQKHVSKLTDQYGNAIGGATVAVTTPDGIAAVIYSDNSYTPKSNPFLTDADDGGYFFYAADGRYAITFSKAGFAFDPADTSDIVLYDQGTILSTYNYLYNSSFEIYGAFDSTGTISGEGRPPTGWTCNLSDPGNLVQEGIGIAGVGSRALRFIPTAVSPLYVFQDATAIYPTIAAWRGETVTFGCWISATDANRAFIFIQDDVLQANSPMHNGNGAWQFLRVSKTLGPSALRCAVGCAVVGGIANEVYFDNAILVKGPGVVGWQPEGWSGRTSTVHSVASLTPSPFTTYSAWGKSGSSSGAPPDNATVGYARMPFNGVARNLTLGVDAAPGPGKTVTSTLRIDGVTVANMTLSLSGTQTEPPLGSTPGEAQFNAGDTWSIATTNPAGSAATKAYHTLEIEERP